MVVRIVRESTKARIYGMTRSETLLLDDRTSCSIPGAWFSQKFKDDLWDGKLHMCNLASRGDHHIVSQSLVPDVLACFFDHEIDFEIEDQRPALPARGDGWRFTAELREYQRGCVDAWCSGNDYEPRAACGILKSSVRSGKTVTSLGAAAEYGVPTLVVVTSLLLLRQFERTARAVLPGVNVGVIGDEERSVGDLTIATAHSLSALKDEAPKVWRRLKAETQLLISDEVHHLKAQLWRRAVLGIPARMRMGLSATVFMGESEELTPEELYLKSAIGPTLAEVSMADVMALGFIVPCTIELLHVDRPSLWGLPWRSAEARVMYENEWRNRIIVGRAMGLAEDGRRTIITVTRVRHAEQLAKALRLARVPAIAMTGKEPERERQRMIKDLTRGRTKVIVSTVLGEGVDIPACDAVVVGEGGRSRVAALQRMRCLTPADGKTDAVFVDMLDATHKDAASQSRARAAAYRAEQCFDFKIGDGGMWAERAPEMPDVSTTRRRR